MTKRRASCKGMHRRNCILTLACELMLVLMMYIVYNFRNL
jgi:hypothetical protein